MAVRVLVAACGVAMASTAVAQIYTSTTQTGSRYNPGPATGGVAQRIVFDDVQIPDDRLGGMTALEVTRVTYGIRRSASSEPIDVDFYWGTVTPGTSGTSTALDPAINLFGSASLPQLANSGFTTELVVIGDGVTPLFTAPLDGDAFGGFGTLFLGMQFAFDTSNSGWRITSGPDVNDPVFWNYNPDDMTTVRQVFSSGLAGTFYLVVEGNPVPAPGALGLLGVAGLVAARRRR